MWKSYLMWQACDGHMIGHMTVMWLHGQRFICSEVKYCWQHWFCLFPAYFMASTGRRKASRSSLVAPLFSCCIMRAINQHVCMLYLLLPLHSTYLHHDGSLLLSGDNLLSFSMVDLWWLVWNGRMSHSNMDTPSSVASLCLKQKEGKEYGLQM